MATTLVRMQFDRQEGNNYYFFVGIYNEGKSLPEFGGGSFSAQHDLLNVFTALPYVLLEDEYVGSWQIPEDLSLKGVKGEIWIDDWDLIEDLLAGWQALLGHLFTNNYEVCYAPLAEPLPEPYATALEEAEPANNHMYNLPVLESQWPEVKDEGYRDIDIAYSVRLEGALLSPAWAWLWDGELSEYHMLALIDDHPIEEEPYIEPRWWDTYAPGDIDNFFGSYDTRYEEIDFKGWNGPLTGTPQNALIRILEGLTESFNHPIIGDDDTMILFLHPTQSGHHVHIGIPYADEDAFFFPDAPPPEYQPVSPILPLFGLPGGAGRAIEKFCAAASWTFAKIPGLYAKRDTDFLLVNETDRLLVDEDRLLEVN